VQLQELACRREEAGQRGGTCGAVSPGRTRVQQQEEEEQLRGTQDNDMQERSSGLAMPRRDDSVRTRTGRTMEPRVKDVGDCCGAKAAVRRDELEGASMQPNTTVTSYSRWNSPSPPVRN
jgi:hypothetical protein